MNIEHKLYPCPVLSYFDFEKNGVKIDRNIFNGIIMYLNIIGGTYLLDYFNSGAVLSLYIFPNMTKLFKFIKIIRGFLIYVMIYPVEEKKIGMCPPLK